ncbi:hypothetical protein [Bradyrhizobium sp. STM 3562]|uniref:hypothetical protein n=1 Tax=Bradyrhizobium sp. STM 3562 TaxID=578924 RepID=UPI00389060B6
MVANSKRQLAEFVIDKAFEPVMRARPDGKSDSDRRTLQHLQDATRAEIERYRGYRSAAELITNFKRDLRSEPAKKVHAQLRRLHLPTLEDIEDEFEGKVRSLGLRRHG